MSVARVCSDDVNVIEYIEQILLSASERIDRLAPTTRHTTSHPTRPFAAAARS